MTGPQTTGPFPSGPVDVAAAEGEGSAEVGTHHRERGSRRPGGSRVWVRGLAVLGALAVGGSAAAFSLMQLLPGGKWLDPISTPLSNYAVTGVGGWFDAALLLLFVGVLALVSALVLARLVRVGSPAFVALGLCGVGLVGMVVFPDYADAAGRLTTTGWLHVGSSVLAFAGPPLACLGLARRHQRVAGCSRLPAFLGWLGAFTLGWFAVLATVAALGWTVGATTSTTGPRMGSGAAWTGTAGYGLAAWQGYPYEYGYGNGLGPGSVSDYGLIERGLTAAELAIAVGLIVFAWRCCRCRTVLQQPARGTGTGSEYHPPSEE